MNANASLSEVELVVKELIDGSAETVPLELILRGLTTVSAFEAWYVGETRAGREMRAIPANNPSIRPSPSLVRLGGLHNFPISSDRFFKHILSISGA